jgi:FkbM family methyltransferase
MLPETREPPQIALHSKSGLWWPTDCDADAGFTYMIRRVTDIDVALKHCRKTAVAVQAGGNIGLWPLRLAKTFSIVHTFEPVPHIYGALRANTRDVPGVVVHNELLSDISSRIVPFSTRPGGVSRAVSDVANANSSFAATTIDALNLPCCDAIFLDVEGHEPEALAGAAQTIHKFRPVITVEVWEANMDAYLGLFDRLGYDHVAKVHGDFVFVPRKP